LTTSENSDINNTVTRDTKMKLSDFTMIQKDNWKKGNQVLLGFGPYQLSIIDDGMGKDSDLFEIATFNSNEGVASDFVELPGITGNKGVRGYLTESDVDAIIKKMYSVTGRLPVQI
jgi:hypothetical protein